MRHCPQKIHMRSKRMASPKAARRVRNDRGARIVIVGPARAAAYASGEFNSIGEATATDKVQQTYEPDASAEKYQEAYQAWKNNLNEYIHN